MLIFKQIKGSSPGEHQPDNGRFHSSVVLPSSTVRIEEEDYIQ